MLASISPDSILWFFFLIGVFILIVALIQLILRISDFKANLEHLRGPMERASDAQKTPRKKPDTFSRPSHENFSEVDTPPSSEVEELSQDLKEDSKTFFKSLLNNIKDDKVPDLGAQTTYYLVLALFPFFIFLLSVLQYTPLEYEIIISTLEGLLPEDAHELIFGTIEEVFTASSGALLSFGALAALWSSLKGANALIKGVNTAYNVEETRNFFQVKAVALLTTIGVPIVILSAFFFIVFGEVLGTYVFDFFGLSDYFIELWNWMRFPIPMLIMVLFFMVFYKFAPNQKLKFRNVFWGALFTVIFWIIASLGFSFYVNNFSNYSAVYGSLGTIVVVLLWLYISSIIIIVGGEVNVVLSRLRRE